MSKPNHFVILTVLVHCLILFAEVNCSLLEPNCCSLKYGYCVNSKLNQVNYSLALNVDNVISEFYESAYNFITRTTKFSSQSTYIYFVFGTQSESIQANTATKIGKLKVIPPIDSRINVVIETNNTIVGYGMMVFSTDGYMYLISSITFQYGVIFGNGMICG